jgi:uncharacterized protein
MTEKTAYEPGTPSWVDLSTPDIEGAKRFYGGLFGWELEDAGPEAGGYHMALLRGKPVAGLGPAQEGGPPNAFWTLYLAGSDVDAHASAITEAGGQIMVGPLDIMGQGRMLVSQDPTGALFGIWEPQAHSGAELVNEHGTIVWNELNTPDIEAAARFYGAVFPYAFQDIDTAPTEYKVLQIDGHAVGGMLQMTAAWEGVPPHWMTYFHVDELDPMLERVGELGGKPTEHPPVDSPYGRFSVVIDPQGAPFTLMQSADPGAG